MIEKTKSIRLKIEGMSITFRELQDFYYACLALDPEESTEVRIITSILAGASVLSMEVEDK